MSEDGSTAPADDDAARPKRAARKSFLLRLPPELMAELRGWADSELRSLNGHIEYVLRQALRQRKGQDPED